jgi:hypothetical protein
MRAIQSAYHGHEGPNTNCSEANGAIPRQVVIPARLPRRTPANSRALHAQASSRSSFDLAGKSRWFFNSLCMADSMRTETWSVEAREFVRRASSSFSWIFSTLMKQRAVLLRCSRKKVSLDLRRISARFCVHGCASQNKWFL